MSNLKYSKILILLTIIILISTFLRLYKIEKQDLWIDESYNLKVINNASYSDLALGIKSDPGSPPIYTIIFKFISDLIGTAPWKLRLPSIVFGILTIPIIFLVGKELFNKKIGLLSALLLGISPFHIYQSQQARPYALVMFISTVSIYFFIKYIKKMELNKLIFLMISIILLGYTHFLGILLLIPMNLYVIYDKKFDKRWVLSQIILAILFIPLVLLMIQGISRGAGARTFFNPLEIFYLLIVFSLGYTGFIFKYSTIIKDLLNNWHYLIFSFIVYLTVIWGFIKKLKVKKNKFILLFFLTPCIFLALFSSVYPLFRPRYLAFIFPYFIVLISIGIFNFKNNITRTILIISLILVSSISLSTYYFSFQREPWSQMTTYIQSKEQNNEVILATRMSSLRYYYQGNLNLFFIDEFDKATLDSYSGVWYLLTNYKQSDSTDAEKILNLLNSKLRLKEKRIYKDDSNELSGDMILLHYENQK